MRCCRGLTADKGIVSTLVDAETSFGEEIWFGLIRRRVELPSSFGIDGDFLSAAVAASIRLWTSSSRDVESACPLGAAIGEVTAGATSGTDGV